MPRQLARVRARLADSPHRFEHIFPRHGDWTPAPVADMSVRLSRLADQVNAQPQ